MRQPSSSFIVALIVALTASAQVGCVNHIKPYTPKRRVYEAPVSTVGAKPDETGSVFDGNSVASRLMTDPRAQRENDLVIIVIDEQASAQRDTSTELGREDSYNTQLNDFLGLLKELEAQNPNFNGAAAIDFAHKNAFKGQGKTTRNDTMFVEGHRVVLVNSEEHHFYISGVIRPEDIDGTGSVPSSRMADAQIEFVGRGNLTSGSGQGWFSRLLDFIWPF
jgi:flagellar L-ring protein FlgH